MSTTQKIDRLYTQQPEYFEKSPGLKEALAELRWLVVLAYMLSYV